MSKFVFLVATLTVGWLIYKLYFKQLLAEGKIGKIKIALIVLGLLFMIMAVTGRVNGIFAVIGAAMTQVMRIMPLLIRFFPQIRQMLDGGSPFGAGQTSKLRSATLIVTVEHSSGKMNGEILTGEFAGKRLSDLSPDEHATLLEYCQRQDKNAARLLLAYLARTRGGRYGNADTGSSGSAGGSTHPDTQMSISEASEVLGIDQNADRDTIIEAHRRLMHRMHPDKGGSNYLAAKINAAKKTLIEAKQQNNT